MAKEHRKLRVIAEEIWRDENHMTRLVLTGTSNLFLSLVPIFYVIVTSVLLSKHCRLGSVDPWRQHLPVRRGTARTQRVFFFLMSLKTGMQQSLTYLWNPSMRK